MLALSVYGTTVLAKPSVDFNRRRHTDRTRGNRRRRRRRQTRGRPARERGFSVSGPCLTVARRCIRRRRRRRPPRHSADAAAVDWQRGDQCKRTTTVSCRRNSEHVSSDPDDTAAGRWTTTTPVASKAHGNIGKRIPLFMPRPLHWHSIGRVQVLLF